MNSLAAAIAAWNFEYSAQRHCRARAGIAARGCLGMRFDLDEQQIAFQQSVTDYSFGGMSGRRALEPHDSGEARLWPLARTYGLGLGGMIVPEEFGGSRPRYSRSGRRHGARRSLRRPWPVLRSRLSDVGGNPRGERRSKRTVGYRYCGER